MSTSLLSPVLPSSALRRDRLAGHPRRLARYAQPDGLVREIVLLPGAHASSLLVDRLAGGLGGSRLLAHLEADEPAQNAHLVCRMYLADADRGCRRLTANDLKMPPLHEPPIEAADVQSELRDTAGNLYRIRPVEGQPRRLRWTRNSPGAHPDRFDVLSLRDLVGALEAYEPARSITQAAITRPAEAPVYTLRHELRSLSQSPFVLNRALREAVLHAIEHHGASMSEIAIRCGRIKHTPTGVCGETTWLSRRIGLKPDSTSGRITPWVHTDVLALIAREGLGITPAEVEVD